MERRKIYRVTVVAEPEIKMELDLRFGSLSTATRIFHREASRAMSDESASVLFSLITGKSCEATLAAKFTGDAHAEFYPKYYKLLES